MVWADISLVNSCNKYEQNLLNEGGRTDVFRHFSWLTFWNYNYITAWISAWITSAQLRRRRHHWLEPTLSEPIFKGLFIVIYKILALVTCKTQWGLETIFMRKSKPKYAYLPSKIVAVWIDRFCLRYDWWRRLQPTSSVSSECFWYIIFYWIRYAVRFDHFLCVT